MISPAIPAAAKPITSEIPPLGGTSSSSLGRLLLRGGLALGLAIGLERGLNFLANMLAARAAGPEVFGTYSIALVTASTIATYTGVGIGATANRFSGQFPRESPQYSGLLRALIIISVSSALVASAVLFAGAEPLAKLLLRNENLAPLLRLSAFSAAAMILLECCRGLLIGQHKFPALLVLSVISGTGLLLILPSAASRGGLRR
ncbi:MAG: oligosaccharide flippase family protein [Pyrinomonadaceae bacterium]